MGTVTIRVVSVWGVWATIRASADAYTYELRACPSPPVPRLQIGMVPGTKEFASPDVEGQTEQVLKNMGAILEAAGAGYANVVK